MACRRVANAKIAARARHPMIKGENGLLCIEVVHLHRPIITTRCDHIAKIERCRRGVGDIYRISCSVIIGPEFDITFEPFALKTRTGHNILYV